MIQSLNDIPLVVLAGGQGSRLKELGAQKPKYLMPLSDKLCFADIHLNWIQKQGFKKVILAVGKFSEQIEDYCQDGRKWNLEIKYSSDGPALAGTGGALKKALSDSQFEWAAFTYGDTLLELNCFDIFKKAQLANPLVCMTIYENKVPGHICNVQILENGGLEYSKSHPQAHWRWIDYGFSFFRKEFLNHFESKLPLDLAEPLETVSKSRKLQGHLVTERFWEIGSPEALLEFQKRFSNLT